MASNKENPLDQLTPTFWLESGVIKILIGAVGTLVVLLVSLLTGLDEAAVGVVAGKFVDPILAIITTGLTIWAMKKRVSSATPPLTLTKEAAEAQKPIMAKALVEAAQSPEVQAHAAQADSQPSPNGDMQ